MPIVFDKKFFEGEERCGFYVEPVMKHAWAAQLVLLDEIRGVLDRYGIKWFAAWGTLLGAVRHGGFIPWDDDLDIMMLREDYDRFLQIPKDEWPEGLYVLNEQNNPGFVEMLSRVVNTMYVNWEPGFLDRYQGCPFQVGIDVFPLDYIPREADNRQLMNALIELVSHTASMYREGMHGVVEAEREAVTAQIETFIGMNFDRNGDMDHQLLLCLDRICAMFGPEDGDEVGFAVHTQNTLHEPADYYRTTVEIPFENTFIPVPIGYGKILRDRYGEYFRFNRNHPHDYPFYEKQQVMLRKYTDKDPQLAELLRIYI